MLTILKTKKPIIMMGESQFKYKYIRTAYLMGDIPIQIQTDLKQQDFEKFIDGYFTQEQVDRFELTGSFK